MSYKEVIKSFSYLTIILLLIWIALNMKNCSGEYTDGDRSIDTVFHSDTIYKKGKTDTIFFKDTVMRYIKVPIESPIEETDGTDVYNIYNLPIKDSLIEGNIFTKIEKITGVIEVQDFKYTPKFPKYILRVDTLTINNETIITKTIQPKSSLLLGGGVGGNEEQININLYGGFRTSKGMEYLFHYDIINKTYNLGILTPLKWRK